MEIIFPQGLYRSEAIEIRFFLAHNVSLDVLFSSRETSVSAIDGKWHHICATWENTAGSWKLYKDGAIAAQGQGLQSGKKTTLML